MSAPQTDRDQWIARVVDRQVAPIWHDRFARLIFRDLPLPSNAFALDAHCGSGRTTAELLQRLDDSSRVLAIEPDEASITMAKTRVRSDWRDRVYFKHGDVRDVTNMATDSYDLTVANLVLGEAHDWKSVLSEFVRVTKPGGTILATFALRGTWTEVEDLLREVLRETGQAEAVRRLDRLTSLRPTGPKLAAGVTSLGLSEEHFVVEQERFSLLFSSGREFLFSPVIEHGPLRLWKATMGEDARPQELFWRLKESIDTYYAGHVFSVSVTAGILRVQVPDPERDSTIARDYWSRFPQLDAIFRGEVPVEAPEPEPAIAPEPDEDLDLDIEMDVDEEPAPDARDRADPDAGAADVSAAGDSTPDPGPELSDDTATPTGAISGPDPGPSETGPSAVVAQTPPFAPVTDDEPDAFAADVPVEEDPSPTVPAVEPELQLAPEGEPFATEPVANAESTQLLVIEDLEDIQDEMKSSGVPAPPPPAPPAPAPAPVELLAPDTTPDTEEELDIDSLLDQMFEDSHELQLSPESESGSAAASNEDSAASGGGSSRRRFKPPPPPPPRPGAPRKSSPTSERSGKVPPPPPRRKK